MSWDRGGVGWLLTRNYVANCNHLWGMAYIQNDGLVPPQQFYGPTTGIVTAANFGQFVWPVPWVGHCEGTSGPNVNFGGLLWVEGPDAFNSGNRWLDPQNCSGQTCEPGNNCQGEFAGWPCGEANAAMPLYANYHNTTMPDQVAQQTILNAGPDNPAWFPGGGERIYGWLPCPQPLDVDWN